MAASGTGTSAKRLPNGLWVGRAGARLKSHSKFVTREANTTLAEERKAAGLRSRISHHLHNSEKTPRVMKEPH